MSQIVRFYSGKSVLVTGATGFMGKVLLAKILTSMPDIKDIYVLLRPKKGLTPQERIKKLLNNKPFTLIQIEQAQMEKVVAISGDVTEINLGLSADDKAIIINTVSVVFHFAAAVRFDLTLKQAVQQNVIGTEGVLNLCSEMKNLKAMVHLSTAYCNIDIENAEERVYEIPNVSPCNFVEMTKYLNNEQLAEIEKKLISPHPNTYTYTKRLAEIIVANAGAKLPLVIVRPSIVLPACHEPVPGWVDSLNGPVGLSVALVKGVLQVIWIDKDLHTPYVPVDVAIDIAIIASFVRSTEKFAHTPVFHATKLMPVSWAESRDYMAEIAKRLPVQKVLWHNNSYFTKSRLLYLIGNFFLQLLPALLIDFLLIMFLQEPFLWKVQKRVSEGVNFLSYFMLTSFDFKTDNMDSLLTRMNADDRAIFNVFERHLEVSRYLDFLGIDSRRYCLNEEPSDDFIWILQYYGYYVLDKVFKAWIFYTLFKFGMRIVVGIS